MKNKIKFTMEFKIDKQNKQLHFLLGTIDDNPRFYGAKSAQDHFENLALALSLHGLTEADLKKAVLISKSNTNFDSAGITFEQLMKDFNVEVKA